MNLLRIENCYNVLSYPTPMVSQPVIQGYLLILLMFSSSIILLQINDKFKIII